MRSSILPCNSFYPINILMFRRVLGYLWRVAKMRGPHSQDRIL
uniref:Uncharacterized protein n=1 Tax=Utricularia reniformis TaxID=192314 RepID=A0A1Y0B0A5_9LAMI|nr:hypothetical protein AEK19_MT0563 [Utricularia reniformis]ART30819.1 hypothetical protein AEK19_MT0563 [Utricularia reniformis]